MTHYRQLAFLPLLFMGAQVHAQAPRSISTIDSIPLSALVGFEANSGQQQLLSQMQDILFQELLKTRKWRLVDPQRVTAEVHDPSFQETQACSTSCMGSLGKRLGVQTLLLPDLNRRDGISRLTVREVSVATGEVLREGIAETDEPISGSGSSRHLAILAVGRLSGDPSTAARDSGTIRVTTNSAARIWIDGMDVGDAPLTIGVWPGLHRVSVEPDHDRPPEWEHRSAEPNFTVGAVFFFQTSSGGGYGHREGYSQRPRPGSFAPPGSHSNRGGSHRGGGDDGTATIVAGTLVAALGVGLVAEAASMPDSLWSGPWRDVKVKAADTAVVEFRKESNGDKTAMSVMGILGIVLGVMLVVAVVASKN